MMPTCELLVAEIELGEADDFTLQQAHSVINRLRRAGIWTRADFMAHCNYVRVEMGRPSEQWDAVDRTFISAVYKAAEIAKRRLLQP
jgi:hypothetical protein